MADGSGAPARPEAPPVISGLSAFAEDYDVILCDVWGVVHNGLAAFAAACDALEKVRAAGGHVILVSNAPRPSRHVATILDQLGASRTAYDTIVTSGDVTHLLLAAQPGAQVYHLGPDRDLGLYEGLDLTLAPLEAAQTVVCTGLFDDTCETADDYQPMLQQMRLRNMPFICANPDIVVERGAQLIYCAGAIAEAYDALGGQAVYCGKPHAPIYEIAMKKAEELRGRPVERTRVLGIGDALRTDITGASRAGLDSLFIAGGIHAAELNAEDGAAPDLQALSHLFQGQPQPRGVMTRLSW
ncbi:TIGR01459 family HAD-type hydrolase [Xanthobacter sp. TB0139]|uniref:TIGR01459 family HAD-type hydrolase n=1 Tax=Xanthobacter sp. TB0139 TaxID=3459178 RepID=UPI004039560D